MTFVSYDSVVMCARVVKGASVYDISYMTNFVTAPTHRVKGRCESYFVLHDEICHRSESRGKGSQR